MIAEWALELAELEILPLWEEYAPTDDRPTRAIRAARKWLAKEIKLPEAKRAILACHAAAREAETNPKAQEAARAIGQTASTIHSKRHALGLISYGLLALAYEKAGVNAPWSEIIGIAAVRCDRYLESLKNRIHADSL